MIPRRLALLHFSNTSARGGAEEHILTLLRGLDRECFTLHLVCTPVVATALRDDVPRDVEVVPFVGQPVDVRAALRFARLLRERRVDILHSHLFCSSLFASPVGKLCRVPVVVETPHIREQWRHGLIKGHFFIDRLVGRCVDHYIAVGEANGRHLADGKGLPRRKIRVIHNGCDLGRFEPGKASTEGLRSRLGFDDTDVIIVVVGRLELQKGHRVLLEALPTVVQQHPRTRLVCVGEGTLRGELEAEAGRRGLGAFIRFVGYQGNVPDWMALADVLVLPSFFEGLPLVAIEALASERAVVATAVDGTPEIIVDGRTGLTVPPGDAAALAAALDRVLRDPDLRRNLARAGRHWVLERFTQEGQVRKTQQLYLEAWEQAHRERSRIADTASASGRGA